MDDYERFRDILKDEKKTLYEKTEAAFGLRDIGDEKAATILYENLSKDSVVLRHEMVYILGQMNSHHLIPKLIEILKNEKENPVVRHEAGESLGALSIEEGVFEVLKEYSTHSSLLISETCSVAIDRIIDARKRIGYDIKAGPFPSIDPALSIQKKSGINIGKLRDCLLDKRNSLYIRYSALFSLRNDGSNEAIEAIEDSMIDKSPLFKHEVAFVLGQLGKERSVPILTKHLCLEEEDPVVRHECAISLGSIQSPEVPKILSKYLKHENALIRESCIIALDSRIHNRI